MRTDSLAASVDILAHAVEQDATTPSDQQLPEERICPLLVRLQEEVARMLREQVLNDALVVPHHRHV